MSQKKKIGRKYFSQKQAPVRNRKINHEEYIQPMDEPFRYPDHPKPRTRREFLAQGFIGMSTAVATPSLLSMLTAQHAMAQACPSPSQNNNSILPAFIQINLEGGAALGASFVARTAVGDLNPNPVPWGIGNAAFLGNNVQSVGVGGTPLHGAQNLIQQLQANLGTADLSRAMFITAYGRSRNDSGDNDMGVLPVLSRLAIPSTLPELGQNQGTGTGVRMRSTDGPVSNPTIIRNSIQTIFDSVQLGGPLAAFTVPLQQALARAVKRMNDSQLDRISRMPAAVGLKSLLGCNMQSIQSNLNFDATRLDPRQDADVINSTFAVNANSNANDQEVIRAGMVLAGLTGNANGVAIEMGGYDYHNNTRTTGEQRDGVAGALIGKILSLATLKNRPVYILLSTDGTCTVNAASDNSGAWRSDGPLHGHVGIAYDPTRVIQLITGQMTQLGALTSSGNIMNTYPGTQIPTSSMNHALAHLINFGAMAGQPGLAAITQAITQNVSAEFINTVRKIA